MLIIDSQSVKNASGAELKGYDGGKKISGIKRHVVVDTQGLPHAIHISAANISDSAGGIEMLKNKGNEENLFDVETVLADGTYQGEKFAQAIQEALDAKVQIAKRSALHTFKVIPKRWIVERSFSWLDKCRLLWKNCERLTSSSLAAVQLAFIRIILKRS